MDSSDVLTPANSSTITTSSDASSGTRQVFYNLEICLISAQDLPQVSKSMRTYAVAWIHPRCKLTSCVDQKGHTNPTWNERFSFCVDDDFLVSDNAAVTIEIYNSSSWFKDVLVGTVRVLMNNLISLSAVNNPRFVALQIRAPSGKFQGKLNMCIALMDGSKVETPPYSEIKPPTEDNQEMVEKNGYQPMDHDKIHLWHSHSLGSHDGIEEFAEKGGSVCNGSMVNGGSELCSDVGPSASIVAAEIAQRLLPPQPAAGMAKGRRMKEAEDIGSSVVMKGIPTVEANAKGLKTRWKKEDPFSPMYEGGDDIGERKSRREHMRRHSDGGLFSCFGNAYGFEFTIVCGAPSSSKPNFKESTKSQKKKKKPSEANSA